MAVALYISENGRKIDVADIVNGEGGDDEARIEETLTDAIRDKYCRVREFYDADIPSALRIIKESGRECKPGMCET